MARRPSSLAAPWLPDNGALNGADAQAPAPMPPTDPQAPLSVPSPQADPATALAPIQEPTAPARRPWAPAQWGGEVDVQPPAPAGAPTGLAELMESPSRGSIEDAMYAGQEESITRAMEAQLDRMLEGQFGRGVGSSTQTVDLTSDLTQEYYDALARARREAFLGAGAEGRAETATRQAGEALGLQRTGMEQQAQQFEASLGSQERQFDAQMQSNYQQLAQQAQQFGATLDANTQQALAARAQQMTLAQMQLGQQAGQFQQSLAQQATQFGGTMANAQAQRDLQAQLAAAQLAQQGQQFGATLNFNNQSANNALISGALGAGVTGLASLLGPTLGGASNAANQWLSNLLGITPTSTLDPTLLQQLLASLGTQGA